MTIEKIPLRADEVKMFLAALWPNQKYGFLAVSTDGVNGNGLSTKFFSHPLKEDLLLNALRRWVPYNVWFSIGLFEKRPHKGRGKVSDVIGIPGFVADIDCKGGVHNEKNLPTKEEALESILEFPFKPSMIIWSGGGFQAYWIFDEPWIFGDSGERKKATDLSLRWQRYIVNTGKEKGWKLDSVGSLEHLFRIPGTFNHKADPVPVEIVEMNDFRYSVDSIQSFLDDIPREQQRQDGGADSPRGRSIDTLPFAIQHLIEKGAEKGKRSEAIGSVLTAMARAGVPDDEIISAFETEAIGEKFREKGCGRVNWLQDEIGRARAFVGNAGGPVQWEKPILLDDYQVPVFDVELPGILGEMVQATAAATETPIELAVGDCLAVLATAVHGKTIVRVKPGYTEPLNVWIAVFLEPGNRKTAVLILTTKPLIAWEAARREHEKPRIKAIESERKSQEARIKRLRAQYGKAEHDQLEEIQYQIRKIEEEMAAIPVYPKVWVDDVTPEHFGTLLGDHDGWMAVISSEGGIIEIIAGRYNGGIPNLDVFLKSHAGDPVRVDRGSREPVDIERPASTFGLSPQPDVLKSMAEKKGFRGRGLLGRFLYFLPKSNMGHRTLETEPIPETIGNKWERLIHTLLDIEPQRNDGGQVEPFVIDLSQAAYNEWFEFAKAVEIEMLEGGRFEFIKDWAGKLPGAAARLAGLLHCVQHDSQPWAESISVETMGQALNLAAIAASHAEAAFNLMGADQTIEGARKIWRWVERGQYGTFTKRDCFDALKGHFYKVINIEPALGILEERHYIASFTQKTGGRPSIVYSVNPKITQGWN